MLATSTPQSLPSVETVSLHQQPLPPHAKSLSPRSALAATYATYVVRVHTRHGIKTISFDLLAAFFTFTAKKAAEDLGISSRTLIRVCRSLGIRRWPYLGFRSEKNVERIRQEAIENLRRKLEREGTEQAASGMHTTTTCLRGASAKRLLQVKLPQAPAMAAFAMTPRMQLAEYERAAIAAHSQSHTPLHRAPHCVNTIVSPSASASAGHHGALLTPPPSQQAFNLEMNPSMSPRRHLPALQMPSRTPHQLHQCSQLQLHQQPQYYQPQSYASQSAAVSTSASSPMPALNVLVDATILTAFKSEVESQLAHKQHPQHHHHLHHHHTAAEAHARTMSMRDILSNTAMAA